MFSLDSLEYGRKNYLVSNIISPLLLACKLQRQLQMLKVELEKQLKQVREPKYINKIY